MPWNSVHEGILREGARRGAGKGDGMLTVMMYATSLATTSKKHSDIDKTQLLLPRRCAPYIFFPESVGSSRRS